MNNEKKTNVSDGNNKEDIKEDNGDYIYGGIKMPNKLGKYGKMW